MSAWTREAVEALGPTTNVPTTARVIGVDPETVYASIRRGDWTATRVLRIGRAIKIPTLDIVRLLFAPDAVTMAPLPAVPSQCQHGANGQLMAAQSQSQCGCGLSSAGAVLPLRATS
jgi:hypothetical protein